MVEPNGALTLDKPAMLMLEDGTCFTGISCGASGEVFGEICFNTSVVGYLEIMSDPCYAGKIITMTYPQIGNYGVARADLQSDTLALRGLVVHDICHTPSSFRSELSLPDFLAEQGVVAISDVDTRALVQHIRDNGVMRAGILAGACDLDPTEFLGKIKASAPIAGQDLVQTVSTTMVYEFLDSNTDHNFILKPGLPIRHHVVVYDCGVARSVLRDLQRAGMRLTVVPWDTSALEALALAPDGVFFSGGPGDPEAIPETVMAARALLGTVPVFGMGLGHQILSLAAGAQIEKLGFGHHGGNQPVMDLRTHSVEITAQSHSFSVVFSSLGAPASEGDEDVAGEVQDWARLCIAPIVDNERFGRIQLTHVNLNDKTSEGIAFLDIPAFSVQFHPESTPGLHEPHGLFSAFTDLMDE